MTGWGNDGGGRRDNVWPPPDDDGRSGSYAKSGASYNFNANQGYSGGGGGFSVRQPPPLIGPQSPADAPISPPSNSNDWKDVWQDGGGGGAPDRRRSRSPRPDRERRYRSRSRSRSPRRRRRSRSRERSTDRRRTPSPNRDWQLQNPSHMLVISRLPPSADENTLWLRLASDAVTPIDIRMARNTAGGSGRYAYIEFADQRMATKFMVATKGILELDDRHTAYLEYDDGARARIVDTVTHSAARRDAVDWICDKCTVLNFARRDKCFKCGQWCRSAMANTQTKGDHDVGIVPCDTLLLRDLPLGCIEADIAQSLGKVTTLTPLRISMATNNRFAYVQMSSVLDAQRLHTTLTSITRLVIAGRKVTISFSTMPLSTMSALNMDGPPGSNGSGGSVEVSQADRSNAAAAVAQNALARQRMILLRTSQPPPTTPNDGMDASTAARMMANAQQQIATQQQHMQLMHNPPPTLNPAVLLLLQQQKQQMVVAQSAVQQAQQRQIASLALTLQAQQQQQSALQNTPTGGTVQTPHGLLPVYPEPDTSTYQFEATSGYYFDPATGLYYDGNSRLYYNGDMHKWLYWNGEYKTFLPCAEQKEGAGTTKGEGEKKAKDIAKDMEEWARKSNKSKKGKPVISISLKGAPPKTESPPSAGADVGFAMMGREGKPLAAFAETGSDDEQRTGDAPSTDTTNALIDAQIDWATLTCLLCRRKFDAEAKLSKHVNVSELHKRNMVDLLSKERQANSPSTSSTVDWTSGIEMDGGGGQSSRSSGKPKVYRDRAAERRTKHGHEEPHGSKRSAHSPEEPTPWTSSVTTEQPNSVYEQPNANGINAENKGNRMLRGMGWRDGEGLGKSGQGIRDPITADLRAKGVGLGAVGAEQLGGDATYRQKLMHSMRNKFDAMQ